MKENKKGYSIKPTKEQLEIMKKFWKQMCEERDTFYNVISALEDSMSVETRIDGLEFFSVDGEYVGIGNDERTMKLIQYDKLGGYYPNEMGDKSKKSK